MRQTLSKATRLTVLGAAAFFGLCATASADVTSDQSGAILIFPKVVFDSAGVFTGGVPTDTLVQITNTSNSQVSARCMLIDTTSRCNGNGIACTPDTAVQRCGSLDRCEPNWIPHDFRMTLTKRQPITWRVSEGMNPFPCAIQGCPNGQDNGMSSIPLAGDDPFFGEIQCVEVDSDDFQPSGGLNPANGGRGDLAGHATIVAVNNLTQDADVDARKYNGIAIQATALNDGDDTLLIGGPNEEYSGCPHSLVLNHAFDDADVSFGGSSNPSTASVQTDITVVPCSQNFNSTDVTAEVVLQFLVFNEFEQRFSGSSRVDCWRDVQLSDLTTRPGDADDAFSIFNVGVQGTIVGQTRIRPVPGAQLANGVLAIAEQRFDNGSTTASNIHFVGTALAGDVMGLHPDQAP